MKKILGVAVAVLLTAGGATAGAFDFGAERQALLDRLEAIHANADGLSEAERLQQFIDLGFEYTMLEHPEFATYLGLPQGQDRWTDNSFEAEARREQDEIRSFEILESIDREQLEGNDRLNYDLMYDQIQRSIEGHRFHGELMAITQLNGVQQNVPQMFALMRATNVQDYENILARMAAVPTVIDQAMARLEKGLEKGVTPPKVTLRDVPQQIQNLLVDDPMQSAVLRQFAQFPSSIPEADQERLRSEAVKIFTEKVKPAYQKLYDFMSETYVPGARETIAMSALPDGPEWYRYNVAQMTTTDLTPREIHDIGQSEVKRIRGEMDTVIADSGFEGSFEEFTEFLRTDPQFYFETAEELLAAYRDIAKRADNEMIKLFGTLPRTPYGVVPVPAYAEKSQTTAYYQPGSLEGGRPGQFFANTYALDTRPKWEMEALTLHEAVPGHHHQIAIAQELEEQPWFRRFGGYTAFVEGWGLYSESLGEDMGFYQDPYSKFGQLTYEMWRAIRLVVDTGMHAFDWSRQDAIDFFTQNTGKTEHDIVVEVDRYIVWPGQALAYKIGELKIKELRKYAETELAEDFDVRAFHDAVLTNGALPLTVLEQNIQEWVEKMKQPEVAEPTSLGS